jgi:hypothetical protein
MALTATERLAYLDRYERGPALLLDAWREVPAEARLWRPGPAKWSAHEVVLHCADSEVYAAIRIRLLLADPAPLIVGYDENRWAQVFDYHAQDPELALALVASVRASSAACLRSLPETAFGRDGRHTQSGAYSDADWFRIYAEHLEIHAAQIRRNLAAWKDRPAG